MFTKHPETLKAFCIKIYKFAKPNKPSSVFQGRAVDMLRQTPRLGIFSAENHPISLCRAASASVFKHWPKTKVHGELLKRSLCKKFNPGCGHP